MVIIFWCGYSLPANSLPALKRATLRALILIGCFVLGLRPIRALCLLTKKVDHSIADTWLVWLKEEHIPDIIHTGCFTHATVLRLLEVDETEGPTYAVQYHAESNALYNRYLEQFSGNMRKKGVDKWGDKFIAFRSVMEVVH